MPVTIQNLMPTALQEIKNDLSLLPVFLGKGEPTSWVHLITTDDYTIKAVTVAASNFSLDVEVAVQVSYSSGIINLTIIPPGNWAKWEGEVIAGKNTSLTIYVSYPATPNPPLNMYLILSVIQQKE